MICVDQVFYRDGKPYEPTANDKSATNWCESYQDRDTWPPDEE